MATPERAGEGAAGTPPAMAPQEMTPEELRAAFLRTFPSIALAIFLGAVDQTIVATALPAIAATFGTVERVSWIVVGYLAAATVAAPVYGRLGDAYGRRRVLMAALAVHAAGAGLAAVADGFGWLVAARLVQGLGGGGLLTMAMALIGEAIPPRERGRFQGWIAATFVLASSLGPVLGGWLTQHLGWRAVFWVPLPLLALAIGLAWRLPRRPAAGGGRLDLPGVLLFAAFVAPALVALGNVQRVGEGALPLVLGAGALAGLALWALLCWERRAASPLLPLALLREPAIWRTNLVSALVAGALVGLLSFLPIYLTTVRGLPPGSAGLLLLPFSLGGGLGGMISGRVLARTGIGMPAPAIGLAAAAATLALIAPLAAEVSDWTLAVLFGLAATGLGTAFPIIQITVQVAGGPARLGAAAASVQYFRSLGSAAGTAVLGAVLFGTLTLLEPGAGPLFGRLVREGAALLPTLPAGEAEALRAGLQAAFRATFLAAAVLCAAAAAAAWSVPLRRV